jgi:DNA repair exonuclease SbcCD ATPase subunit
VATKKKAASRGARATASAVEAALRARDIVLERIESQMQVVVEAVTGMRVDIDAKLTALEARLSERIGVLEQVVRKNSEDIRKNSEDLQRVRAEVVELRRDFDRRSELARLGALEDRVARVEAKLGIAL